MAQKTIECACCGKVFQKKCGSQKYCGKQCSEKMEKIIQRQWEIKNSKEYKDIEQKRKKEKIGKSIRDINAEALKAGMSYGKYVAMMGL